MLGRVIRGAGRLPRFIPSRALSVSLEEYGTHLFKGAVAAPYLEKAGLPKNTLESNAWTTNGNADKVK